MKALSSELGSNRAGECSSARGAGIGALTGPLRIRRGRVNESFATRRRASAGSGRRFLRLIYKNEMTSLLSDEIIAPETRRHSLKFGRRQKAWGKETIHGEPLPARNIFAG
jgi:hypothetical protein